MSITEITTTQSGTSRGEELSARIIGSLIGGAELLTIELGRRLGLYRALFDLGPTTSNDLADRAGINRRYAREWLEQQAAAGLVDVTVPGTADTREYLLPGAHVPVLLDEAHPLSTVGAAAMLAGFGATLPEVERAYQTGDGIGFSRFGDAIRDGIALINRPSFTHAMSHWIASMPDIEARLQLGAPVLDAGCGVGWSTIALAKAFPGAIIVGADTDTASIVEARGNAQRAGVSDRVTFIEANVSDAMTIRSPFHDDYALVTVFEALHDMGEPIRALEAFRDVLAPGGAVFIADELVGDEFAAPAGEMERVQYAASVLHCLPATMAESTSVANGTVMRAPTVLQWGTKAGFESVQRVAIEHPFWQFYRFN